MFVAQMMGCAPGPSDTTGPALDAVDVGVEAADDVVVDVDSRGPCSAPEGMTHNPRSVEEAAAWINAMEKPLSLPCFVASLHRPCHVERGQPSACGWGAEPEVVLLHLARRWPREVGAEVGEKEILVACALLSVMDRGRKRG